MGFDNKKNGASLIPSGASHLSQSSVDDVVKRIVFRDGLRAARTSTLLYLLNTALAPLAGLALVFLLSPIYRVSIDPFLTLLLESYGAAITLYAGLVYLRMRSHPSPSLGTHFIILGVLGFAAGTILYGYAGLGFVSVGYWLRQAGRSPLKCNRDDSVLVVYGGENLACTTCSRIVKVGTDIPRQWRTTGLAVLVLGIALYALNAILPASLIPDSLRYVISILFTDGLAFLFFLINPQSMGAGRIRLPEHSP